MSRSISGPSDLNGLVFLSNVRCGSTHLITTLGQLPGVHADFEIKWRMPGLQSPVHLHLDPEAPSLTALIAGFPGSSDWAVSKLVIHPRNPLLAGDGAVLRDMVDRDRAAGIRFVHLTRGYFAICISTLLRGNWHLLADGPVAGTAPRTVAEIAGNAHKFRDAESGTPPHTVTFRVTLMTVLRLLVNDLLIHEMTGPDCLRLEYDTITDDLPGLMTRIGLPEAARAALPAALDRPATRKLMPLDPSGLPVSVGFRAMCAYCDFLRAEVFAGRRTAASIFEPPNYPRPAKMMPVIVDPILRRMRSQLRAVDEAASVGS